MGLVLEQKLEALGDCLAAQFGRDPKREVDARRDAAARDTIPVDDNPLLDGDGAQESELIARQPVAGRAIAVEQACARKDQRARAYRRDVPGLRPCCGDEAHRLDIVHQRDLAGSAAHAQHVKVGAIPERGGRQQGQADVAGDRLDALPQEVHARARQARQHLEGSCHVELGHARIEQASDLDRVARHRLPP